MGGVATHLPAWNNSMTAFPKPQRGSVFSLKSRTRKASVRQPGVVDLLEARRLLSVTYFVSPSGNDSASGTSVASAFQTLDKINSLTLEPGDSVLLNSGSTFTGQLSLTSSDAGTSSNPVRIGSYGSGRAAIDAGTGSAIVVTDAGGISIENLDLLGSGRTTNTGSGIDFINTLANDTKISYLRIDQVDAGGFGKYGVQLQTYRDKSGFRDVRMTSVDAHDNGLAGIYVWGKFSSTGTGYAHSDVYVGNSTAYNNSGVSGTDLLNTGSGIVLSDVDGGVIERSVAYNNGWLSNSSQGGPVGIWVWDSNNITIQYNESHHNRTAGGHDGGGFDLDGGTTNSIMQYNYSHDNDGAGYLLSVFSGARPMGDNVVRYNVSENDARKNSDGAIFTYGSIGTTDIYNNTVYLTPAGSAAAVRVGTPTSRLRIRNNIFQTTGGASLVEAVSNSGVTFEGNAYWSSGSTFKIRTSGVTYSSLSSWQSATVHEQLNGLRVGLQVDPGFQSPGAGTTFNSPNALASLQSYRLNPDSLLIDAGLNLSALFGVSIGTRDFAGQLVPTGLSADVGAFESTTIATPPPPPPVDGSTGLIATYFDTLDLTGTSLSRIDQTVAFQWAYGSPDPSIGSNGFSARWSGMVHAPTSETYRFYVRADDGVRLWVDDQLLIDHWAAHAVAEDSATIALQADQNYSIRLEYFENAGQATVELRWSSASIAKQIIPATALSPLDVPVAVDAYTSVTIGNPAITGSTVIKAPNSAYDITAGGTDVFGSSDQLRFVYREVTGDFDTQVRIESLSAVDTWTKAGLMVRTSLDAGSVNAFMLATPTRYRMTTRSVADGSTTPGGAGTPGYPNTWVRLKRTGGLVQGFSSSNGEDWTLVSQLTLALPDAVLVGLAVTSHNSGQAATATFSQLQG